jgi:hypothetical protein
MIVRWLLPATGGPPRPGFRCLVTLFVACLAALPGHAETRFAGSGAPVFPQPEKGRALVYLLRPIWVLGTLPPLELYDERQIWGYLPVRAYIAVQFEPGERTFPVAATGGSTGGTPAAGPDLFLVAGRTYVLRLDESRDATGTLRSQWTEMTLADLPRYVAAKKLRYVTLTDEGRAALEKARAELVSARRKAS